MAHELETELHVAGSQARSITEARHNELPTESKARHRPCQIENVVPYGAIHATLLSRHSLLTAGDEREGTPACAAGCPINGFLRPRAKTGNLTGNTLV